MFGFGRNKGEQISVQGETKEIKELNELVAKAKKNVIDKGHYYIGLYGSGVPKDSHDLEQAFLEYINEFEEFGRLSKMLNAELAKTPGERLSTTAERESSELQEMTDNAVKLLKSSGWDNPEFIELQEKILEKIKEVDFINELDAKLNNKQIGEDSEDEQLDKVA